MAQGEVQAMRRAATRGSFTYYEWRVYAPKPRKKGKPTYRLVRVSPRFKQGDAKEHQFPGIPVDNNIRDGSEVK